jgi:hypothetical protein
VASTNNGTTKPVRCAIYTRKSTEEGLDQDFNSLDAQRDAGPADADHEPGPTSSRLAGAVAILCDYLKRAPFTKCGQTRGMAGPEEMLYACTTQTETRERPVSLTIESSEGKNWGVG